ncbi:MAG: SulP family inorganic anion transporter [Anaerolineales bacterium]|nr:MAG: SulP family inorganic anion transporter [Anaerolineales bacterium]
MKDKPFASMDPRQIVTSITAGLVIGLIVVVLSISLATLVFTGEMSSYVPRGIGIFLFGGLSMALVTSFLGSLPGTAIGPQDGPAALLAVAAGGIAGGLAGSASAQVVFSTTLAGVMIGSLITGLIFLLIGQFQLGNLVRYIPYPVVGGFLAGTGWLLTRGAIEVMAGETLNVQTLLGLMQSDKLLLWLPGTIYAMIVLVVLRKVNHFLVWPGIVFSAVILFYAALFATGTSIEQARSMGLLLQSFPSGGLWKPFTLATLNQVDWNILAGQADKLIPVPLVSLIAFLLNATGLELVAKRDIDLNHELRVTGLANLAAGLGGGPPGYHLLGATALGQRMGAKSRIVTVTTALVCGLVLIAGGGFVSFLPVALLSSLLLVLGLSFLIEWVYDAWFKLPRAEYLVVMISLVVIAATGFLEGVGAGIIAATILFVIKYSRINTVRDTLNGTIYHAKVERPAIQREILHKYGMGIHIFRLQGYIFFGTSDKLLGRVRELLEDTIHREHFIVLDFHRVHGLDSSAVSSFTRMQQLAELHDIYLVITQAAPSIRQQMIQGGFTPGQRVQIFPTLDHGVEWCENMLLQKHEASTQFIQVGIKGQLRRTFPKPALIDRLLTYLERMEVDANMYLMRRGDPPEAMYFIESGRLNVLLETDQGEMTRLRNVRSGTVVGEVGMYLKGKRTANVVTEQKSVLYRLTAEAMKQMENQDAETASALHEWIARLLAERMADNARAIEALLD